MPLCPVQADPRSGCSTGGSTDPGDGHCGECQCSGRGGEGTVNWLTEAAARAARSYLGATALQLGVESFALEFFNEGRPIEVQELSGLARDAFGPTERDEDQVVLILLQFLDQVDTRLAEGDGWRVLPTGRDDAL